MTPPITRRFRNLAWTIFTLAALRSNFPSLIFRTGAQLPSYSPPSFLLPLLARTCLPIAADPLWRTTWASIERWSREAWYVAGRSRGMQVQRDVIAQDVWEQSHELFVQHAAAGTIGSLPPPLAAFAQALGTLQLEWHKPYQLRCRLDAEVYFDLRNGSPAMMKKLMQARFKERMRENFITMVAERSRALDADGWNQLKEISECEVDLHGLAGMMAEEKCSLDWRRRTLAVCWGTYPTGKWLERHGWACAAECAQCGAADDAAHCLLGCPAEVPPDEL